MKRIGKKWVAVAGVLLVALVLAAVAVMWRHKPPFRFLENRALVINEGGTAWGDSWTAYQYDVDAEFDSVVAKAARQLTANGFALASDQRPHKLIAFTRGDERVVLEGGDTITPAKHGVYQSVYVTVWQPPKRPIWKRLISALRAFVGPSPQPKSISVPSIPRPQ